MTDRRDNQPPMDDWKPEPKPWCPFCCVPANACGCPTGERLNEEHLIRATE